MTLIFESVWQQFAAGLRSTGVGPRELETARVVFFAGGGAVFDFMIDKVAVMEDEDASDVIDALRDEFAAFARSRLPTEH